MRSPLIEEMSFELSAPASQLLKIIRTAPLRYKKFYIPKKTGGQRLVAQPAKEVKIIQRWLIKKLEPLIPIHDSATGYIKGRSIKFNAERHKNNSYFVRFDLLSFFPSICDRDIVQHLDRHCAFDFIATDLELIARACTWAPLRSPPLTLCIGAPTSPLLSNSVMFEFDSIITDICGLDICYTRYSDDLVFSTSTPDLLSGIEYTLLKTLDTLPYPKLRLNAKKTKHASRGGRIAITGIIVTPEATLSVGRERKRLARSMLDRYNKGLLNPDQVDELFGLLAFIRSIEPDFMSRRET